MNIPSITLFTGNTMNTLFKLKPGRWFTAKTNNWERVEDGFFLT